MSPKIQAKCCRPDPDLLVHLQESGLDVSEVDCPSRGVGKEQNDAVDLDIDWPEVSGDSIGMGLTAARMVD